MFGFDPIAAAPISAVALVSEQFNGGIPILAGGDDAWYERERKNKKDRTAEFAKDKASRTKHLKDAWEDLYEPKPVEATPAEALADDLVKPKLVLPEIGSLEPFVYPAINISDEEVQAVVQAALDYRKAVWEQRLTIIRAKLAQKNNKTGTSQQKQDAPIFSEVQQSKLLP